MTRLKLVGAAILLSATLPLATAGSSFATTWGPAPAPRLVIRPLVGRGRQ